MAKINSVKKSKKPCNPIVVRPLEFHYNYHAEFRERLCYMLGLPIKEALRERNLTIKQFCADLIAGGYNYSYDGLRQALIGRNYSVNFMFYSILYAHLDIHFPNVREDKV